jgi:hypothetical protein
MNLASHFGGQAPHDRRGVALWSADSRAAMAAKHRAFVAALSWIKETNSVRIGRALST